MVELKLQREAAVAVWDEIQPLLDAHWHEIAFYPDIPLSPRRDVYEAMDAMGKLRVFTARDDGKLVGYAVFAVDQDIHYSTSRQAKQDIIFLDPAYRNAGNGRALIAYADTALQAEGVQVVYHHVKMNHDFGGLLEAMGYEAVEWVLAKRLDRGV